MWAQLGGEEVIYIYIYIYIYIVMTICFFMNSVLFSETFHVFLHQNEKN